MSSSSRSGDALSICHPVEGKDSHADIMAAFRRRFGLGLEGRYAEESDRDNIDSAPRPVLCFVVQVEHHKAKRNAKARKIYVTCPEEATVEEVLQFVAPTLDADALTSLFMTTEGAYGIPSSQTASSMFMKYGNELTLRTGVRMGSVAWHLRA